MDGRSPDYFEAGSRNFFDDPSFPPNTVAFGTEPLRPIVGMDVVETAYQNGYQKNRGRSSQAANCPRPSQQSKVHDGATTGEFSHCHDDKASAKLLIGAGSRFSEARIRMSQARGGSARKYRLTKRLF